jgi:imidazolonepropionase-like amidohydrolase
MPQHPFHVRATILPEGTQRDLFVVDGRFTFSEHSDAETVLDGGYVVPGLVDAHAHLSLHSPAGDDADPDERVAASARAQLSVGVLAVREPGSPDEASRRVGAGLPRVFTAGHLLARTGRYIPGLGREVEPEDLPRAAEQEARASGAWAKVIADFIEPGGRITAAFPAQVLAEAARRVHALGGRIAAHVTQSEVIEACLAAGFDSIEHGTMVRPDHFDAMLAAGTAWVPTLLIRDGVLQIVQRSGADATMVEATRRDLDRVPDIVRQAAARGVTVLAGTDAGMVPHGLVGREIGLLAAAGLTAEQALAAGSWAARAYLGLPGIEEGAPADLVAYPDDPRADLEVLSRPGLVLLDGKRVAAPSISAVS